MTKYPYIVFIEKNSKQKCFPNKFYGVIITMPIPSFVLEKEFISIANLTKGSEKRKYKTTEVIFSSGSRCDYFFWLTQGTVKISIFSEDGNEKILGFHKNSLFGMDLWYKNSIAVVTATAYTDVELCPIAHDKMKKLIEENPKLGIPLVSYVSDIMRLMVFHAHSHIFLDAKTRVIDILYLYSQMGNDNGSQKNIYVTEQELADLAGISRVHVARILKELRQKDIISTSRHIITIFDEDRLFELCCF